jgi:hypothetical protein
MKEELCRAFCREVVVQNVPIGLAVKTPFRKSDGDAIIFYVVHHTTAKNIVHLEDDGQTIPFLEAAGVDLETQTRAKAFQSLLKEHGAHFNEDEMLIRTEDMAVNDVPRHALNFVSLLLRLQDFLLMTQEHIASTFREDAVRKIRERIGQRATIEEEAPVSGNLTEFMPDLVIRAANRSPLTNGCALRGEGNYCGCCTAGSRGYGLTANEAACRQQT